MSPHQTWNCFAVKYMHLLLLLFSHLVVSDSLRCHGLQHACLPCPSPSPGSCSNSCPSSQWCHPTMSSSHPFSSCLLSFSASGSFSMSQPFASGGKSIGASASSSVLPMNIPGLISFTLDWFGLLADQGTLTSLLQHHSLKASVLQRSAFFLVQLSHKYTTTGKTTVLTIWTFVGKVRHLKAETSLLFNMLSSLVIAFLPRSKCLLISWLHLQDSSWMYRLHLPCWTYKRKHSSVDPSSAF